MLKQKKGQLTLFIIIAVVLVILIILYFYFQGNMPKTQKYDPEVEVLRTNVLNCFSENYQSSLAIIGAQGGYNTVPEPKTTIEGYFFSIDVPYYYYSGEINTPTIEKVESEIKETTDLIIPQCFENINKSSSIDSIKFSAHDTTVTINKDTVTFTTNVLMTVDYNNKTVIVDLANTPITINSKIYSMHEISVYIAESLKTNNEWLPYSDIVEMAKKENLYINLVDSDDATETSIEITDPTTTNYPQKYLTFNKYGAADYEEIMPLLG